MLEPTALESRTNRCKRILQQPEILSQFSLDSIVKSFSLHSTRSSNGVRKHFLVLLHFKLKVAQFFLALESGWNGFSLLLASPSRLDWCFSLSRHQKCEKRKHYSARRRARHRKKCFETEIEVEFIIRWCICRIRLSLRSSLSEHIEWEAFFPQKAKHFLCTLCLRIDKTQMEWWGERSSARIELTASEDFDAWNDERIIYLFRQKRAIESCRPAFVRGSAKMISNWIFLRSFVSIIFISSASEYSD